MKDFQGYRQKKNNEFAQQKAQRLELRNGKKISHSCDSDKHLISYYNVNTSSSKQVMKIWIIISKGILSYHYFFNPY